MGHDRALRVMGKSIGAAIGLLLATALLSEHVAEWRDDRAMKRIGRPIDIGGRSLNIQGAGKGRPTVLLESGNGSPGYLWLPSQRGISLFSRVCWYDRAGLGWSDLGPDPNWIDSAARDLHLLLHEAEISPPYVMVSASLGGYIIRIHRLATTG